MADNFDNTDPEIDVELNNYVKLEDQQSSFLYRLREKRRDYLVQQKIIADINIKKYLSKAIYDDIKLLNADTLFIMKDIDEMAAMGSKLEMPLIISDKSCLFGIVKLHKLWSSFPKDLINNTVFITKYRQFRDSMFEILVASLIEKTGIQRRDKLPILNKDVYEPTEGIHFGVKDRNYVVTIWF
ncbi:MAG: hypothetical protein Barrevirus11_7 [Barrevirus sp.]|uniref:Uncharacterized protein n=1 Tax=Barrevirus sp. TaxID=2487763 RepID=A0A3G4ZQC2_9VIRU|nr:MAG: hypothetical protein Barrevirus11_7 [Barrevirus sp.]